MTIVIPDWLSSAAIGFIFCSFLYAVIKRVVIYISDRVDENQLKQSEIDGQKMVDAAIKQIQEKHGIKKEA